MPASFSLWCLLEAVYRKPQWSITRYVTAAQRREVVFWEGTSLAYSVRGFVSPWFLTVLKSFGGVNILSSFLLFVSCHFTDVFVVLRYHWCFQWLLLVWFRVWEKWGFTVLNEGFRGARFGYGFGSVPGCFLMVWVSFQIRRWNGNWW